MFDVNPTNISPGDYISTKYGVAKCTTVNEKDGTLAYVYLHESWAARPKELPIRQTRLLSQSRDTRQLDFPFVQQEISAILAERNLTLKALQDTTHVTKIPTKRVSTRTLSPKDKLIKDSISKLTPEKLAMLAKILSQGES